MRGSSDMDMELLEGLFFSYISFVPRVLVALNIYFEEIFTTLVLQPQILINTLSGCCIRTWLNIK